MAAFERWSSSALAWSSPGVVGRGVFELLACRLSSWFATSVAIVGMPVACGLWLFMGWSVDALTLALSVLAMTLMQLVLVAQARGERNVKAMLRELVHAVPDADESVGEDTLA